MGKSLAWDSCGEEEKACVGWIERYFNDCVCSLSGEMSFGLGMISLLCWALAEIPQIITNFYNKSGHGVSLAFLMTWIVGDIFNLVGCLLEPVTLPTQFYTALLYTATTVVLVLQTLYYDYWRKWWKSRGFEPQLEEEEGNCKPLNPKCEEPSQSIPTLTALLRTSPPTDVYYTSARSLASSGTPPYRSSYIGPVGSGPSASSYMESSGSDDDGSPRHRARRSGVSKPNRIVSRSVGYGTFMAGVGFPFQTKALMEAHIGLAEGTINVQEGGIKSLQGNPYGLLLGWIMAAIYMGGRLPQIYLNIKRGSVEGLNPLMFMFALIANATYVGSILLRSVEWERIKANAPWLLDAIVCVLLDLFIILQFAYYKFVHKGVASNAEEYEGFMEAKETLI